MNATTMSRRARPILIWDGDCGFCRFWIRRWASITGDAVTYAPNQAVRASFPDIPPERFQESVVLVEPEGELFFGAEAALRALGKGRGFSWLPWLYAKIPGFAFVAETLYGFVARHRMLFSRVTRLLWGSAAAGPSWTVGPWVFLRLLALIYLAAFLSLWVQVHGLIGSEGILPVADYLQGADEQLGFSARRHLPTLLWFGSSDLALHLLCGGGVALSLLLLVGVAPAPVLLILWLCYLSLVTGGQTFLAFQWDSLLLETGLLAVFLAPLRWRPVGSTGTPAIPRLLLWWLNFRLLVLSGVVKLASGDASWQDLSAMEVHHQTQPLPGPLAWFFHHLPDWVHRLEARATFALELVVPFFIFAPRRLRHLAAFLLMGLQVVIALSGNYGFFNLLALALCLLLFDDEAWPRRLRKFLLFRGGGRTPRRELRWHSRVLGPLAIVVLLLTSASFVQRLDPTLLPPRVQAAVGAFAPLRSFNSYGLFAVMTTQRPELVFEGSLDGETWRPYEFRWKPGDPGRHPRQVAPHMPRLDWQAWFAALGSPQSPRNGWVHAFAGALLEGRPQVLALLEESPFPDEPPRYLRVRIHRYTYSDWDTLRADGSWWQREDLGIWARYQR